MPHIFQTDKTKEWFYQKIITLRNGIHIHQKIKKGMVFTKTKKKNKKK